MSDTTHQLNNKKLSDFKAFACSVQHHSVKWMNYNTSWYQVQWSQERDETKPALRKQRRFDIVQNCELSLEEWGFYLEENGITGSMTSIIYSASRWQERLELLSDKNVLGVTKAFFPFDHNVFVLVLAAITEYLKIGGLSTTEVYFSQFQRLEFQDQCNHCSEFWWKSLACWRLPNSPCSLTQWRIE